jgi:hypothetical protein
VYEEQERKMYAVQINTGENPFCSDPGLFIEKSCAGKIPISSFQMKQAPRIAIHAIIYPPLPNSVDN